MATYGRAEGYVAAGISSQLHLATVLNLEHQSEELLLDARDVHSLPFRKFDSRVSLHDTYNGIRRLGECKIH